jgi:hypothetical protein
LHHKYTIFEILILLPDTSAPHNSQIYHKSTPELDARDVKTLSPLEVHHRNPKHFEDF